MPRSCSVNGFAVIWRCCAGTGTDWSPRKVISAPANSPSLTDFGPQFLPGNGRHRMRNLNLSWRWAKKLQTAPVDSLGQAFFQPSTALVRDLRRALVSGIRAHEAEIRQFQESGMCFWGTPYRLSGAEKVVGLFEAASLFESYLGSSHRGSGSRAANRRRSSPPLSTSNSS